MKRRKRIRIGAFALAVAMTVTMMPMDVQAVQELDPSELEILPTAGETVPTEDTASTLDVSQFAMRDDLMTKFDTDETTDIGDAKVYFGENGNGEKQEWWIAGEDPWGGGLVLFAASPLGEKQIFHPKEYEEGVHLYSPKWTCTYIDGEKKPTTVGDNHYGTSELRGVLKELENNKKYFSESEQNLILETTLYTQDEKNSERVYQTDDKLYAAYGVYDTKEVIVGAICLMSWCRDWR